MILKIIDIYTIHHISRLAAAKIDIISTRARIGNYKRKNKD